MMDTSESDGQANVWLSGGEWLGQGQRSNLLPVSTNANITRV